MHDGIVANSALPPKTVTVKTDRSQQAAPASSTDLEINFRPDPTVWDGRFANNGWLQELPKPLTKLTWENAALLSPATATTLGVTNGDVVELSLAGRALQAPVWLLPGHPDTAVTLHLGYGRTQAGRVDELGTNAYTLAPRPNGLWFANGLSVRKVSTGYPLATTQDHQSMEGRKIRSVQARSKNLPAIPNLCMKWIATVRKISLYPEV